MTMKEMLVLLINVVDSGLTEREVNLVHRLISVF